MGNAYVTGGTTSINFPTTKGAYQTTFAGGNGDAFVSKLNAAGSALLYSTYLGGSDLDDACGIAVDSSDAAYVTGQTFSSNFPVTRGAFQTTFGGGGADAFVSKLNSAASVLLYSTYLGGSDFDNGIGISVDAAGHAYVTGLTTSSKFPITRGAFQTTSGGVADAFISKLNGAGSALVYSTYLAGLFEDAGVSIVIDSLGDAYVTGYTMSPNFPVTPGAFQTTLRGRDNAFVSKFSFGIPFCSLRSRLELDVDSDRDDGFELKARFALGSGGKINPLTQAVTLVIGRYTAIIPAGSL